MKGKAQKTVFDIIKIKKIKPNEASTFTVCWYTLGKDSGSVDGWGGGVEEVGVEELSYRIVCNVPYLQQPGLSHEDMENNVCEDDLDQLSP